MSSEKSRRTDHVSHGKDFIDGIYLTPSVNPRKNPNHHDLEDELK